MISEICFTVIIFIVASYIIYSYLTRNFNFWKIRNVKGPEPIFFYGNFKDNILGNIHSAELTKKFYDQFKDERVVGILVYDIPVLILRDLDLIKHVLIRDFTTFSDRGIHVYNKVEPLSQHFFNLPHTTWHPLRTKLSPAFSNSKIKGMFNTFINITDVFVQYIDQIIENNDTLDCCNLVAKFTTEVIGECGFGLKMNQLTEENHEFKKVHSKRNQSPYYNYIRRFLREYFPNVYKHCHLLFYNKNITDYYVGIIKNIADDRKSKDIERNDYIGSLLNLKKNSIVNNIEWTDNLLAAQAYVFFTAGSDTTALIISNTFRELALNPMIQEKLRSEVNATFQENNQKFTFDAVKNMNYLDKVFKETLRKYPLRNIIRQSNRPYTFAGTDISIPANTRIIIPHYAIHRDDEIYPDPDTFDPERFDDSVARDRHSMAYLSFGGGPRSCIGAKLAEYLCKIVIVGVLKRFKLEVSEKVEIKKENDPRNVMLTPKGGIQLRFIKL